MFRLVTISCVNAGRRSNALSRNILSIYLIIHIHMCMYATWEKVGILANWLPTIGPPPQKNDTKIVSKILVALVFCLSVRMNWQICKSIHCLSLLPTVSVRPSV